MAAKKSTAGKRRKKSPRKAALELTIEKRRERVVTLRQAAWPIRDIAKQLNVSVGTVHADLSAALERVIDRTSKAVDLERAIQVERLEVAIKGIWPDVKKGDIDACNAYTRLDARRAKLLGLDAPVKGELTGAGGAPLVPEPPTSQLGQKLDDLLERLTGTPAAAPAPAAAAAGDAHDQPGGNAGAEPSASG